MLKQTYSTAHRTADDEPAFQSINRGYNSVFRPNHLSLGLVVPLETYSQGPAPTMTRHLERVQLAEQLGFSAVWLRDVPFNVPSFGDAGQMYDPFVYLGLLAGQTNRNALGVASIVLPLRHPAHVAKAAASVDVLSGGRLILGVASGDRPAEYPALNLRFNQADTDETMKRLADDILPDFSGRTEWHLLNSYRRAIDLPTRVIFSGKRREYVPVGSTAPSLAPTFPPETTRVGLSKCH